MRASAGPAKFDPGREGSALRSLVRERIEWGDFWGWFNFLPQRREGAKKSKKVKREKLKSEEKGNILTTKDTKNTKEGKKLNGH